MQDILRVQDLILAPIFVLFIYSFARYRKNKRYKGNLIEKFYLPALSIRIIGNLFAALIYQYYYNSGDTFEYYKGITMIWEGFLFNPLAGLELIFSWGGNLSWDALTYRHHYLPHPDTGIVIRVGAVFSILSANTYLCIAFSITAITFGGCWRMYKTFAEMYPHLYKELAWGILFIPSVCFFGTGLQKDSLTLAALGYMTYACYRLFIKRIVKIEDMLMIIVGFLTVFYIKPYILMAFLPALVIWIFFKYRSSIPNQNLRLLAAPMFGVFTLVSGYYVLTIMGTYYQQFALENVVRYTAVVQSSMTVETAATSGSGYSLGSYAPTPLGLLSIAPQAIGVSLFRPFLWEVTNPLLGIAALEGLATFGLTVYLFWVVGVRRIIKLIILNPEVAFSLTFSIVFAFAVGFSSYNFGALMRYKIPAMPFYYAGLVILWSYRKQ